ncbi:hypothetical protein I5F94_03095 [Proteus mirabilis]|uniref:hypothetical protein n=1 Tax=Proteus mirabilis TaxID=584 RepID=UPI0018C569A9|nr:hypothetical protein [Proteus mirabilis]MBG6040440.1 hypothetical protein [Proteus mirabilis]
MLKFIYDLVKSVGFGAKVATLEVYEWNEYDVKKKRLANNTQWGNVAVQHGNLEFKLLSLTHAIIKTDFLIQRNLNFYGIAFLMSSHELIKISKNGNLRLIDDIDGFLNDVTLTSFIGRLGQGITLLIAHRLGYSYVCHLASDAKIKSIIASSAGKNGTKKEKIADFIFENNNKDRTIIESKCSYSIQDFSPSDIKRILKPALNEQVNPWVNNKIANITNGYVVHSALRSIGQTNNSAITYVDPPANVNIPDFDFPIEWVKAKNYAAWLSFCGFHKMASGLFSDIKANLHLVNLKVISICDCDFAILNSSHRTSGKAMLAGIDVKIMLALADYCKDDSRLLNSYEGVNINIVEQVGETISIFPDGTLLGMIDNSQFPVKVQSFWVL